MAILAECPLCHRKQAAKNKKCRCGENLDKAKKAKRVKYWIAFRYTEPKTGKMRQRKESLAKYKDLNPYSIKDAEKAHNKRSTQIAEFRIMDVLPQASMTLQELSRWFLDLPSVKKLATYDRVQICLANFNQAFGNQIVGTLKPLALEKYQEKRAGEGLSPATIDMEILLAGSMVRKAWDNDMVDGRTVKAFRRVKRKLKAGANARGRTLTIEEYQRLRESAVQHVEMLITVAYHTGMRRGELLNLEWKHIDREAGFIRLPTEMTKERRPKNIPINHHVKKVLESLPRAIHHDRVFTYGGKPIGVRFRRAFMSACKKAGILYGQKAEGGLRFHDIRGAFKTNLLRAGVDKALRDTILGHTLKGMDAYYLNPSDEDLRRAMDTYTAWFDAQISDVHQSVAQEVKSVSK